MLVSILFNCILCCCPYRLKKLKSTKVALDKQLVPGRLLVSKYTTFKVQSTLGEGAFGNVVKWVGCSKPIAIKVIKNRQAYHQMAKREVSEESCYSQHLKCAYSSSMNLCFHRWKAWPGWKTWIMINVASSWSSDTFMTGDITAWPLSIWTKVFMTTWINNIYVVYLWPPLSWLSGR